MSHSSLLSAKGVSVRRGGALSRISRNAVGCVSRRPSDDVLLTAINEARQKHTCYSYRRIHRPLAGEAKGVPNHRRVHRLWRDHGMQHPVLKGRALREKGHAIPSLGVRHRDDEVAHTPGTAPLVLQVHPLVRENLWRYTPCALGLAAAPLTSRQAR